jgi:hypothetical protein
MREILAPLLVPYQGLGNVFIDYYLASHTSMQVIWHPCGLIAD